MSEPDILDPVQGAAARLQYANVPAPSGAESWTDLSNVIDIKPPKITAADIDTTVMDTPDQFEDFIPGWANGGEMQATLQFNKTQQTSVYGMFRMPQSYRIMFADGTTADSGSTLAWPGYIKEFSNAIDRKGLITLDIACKVTGKPVFTAGT
jgi:Lambda phage tail tube protein, TTP